MRAARFLVPAVVAAALAPPATAQAELGSTTTINGSTPPGVTAPLSGLTVMLDTVRADGNRLLVQEGVRKPGSRAPIQYHDFSGQTCVLSGTITGFVEGKEPATYPAGTCYDLPPRVAMTAANLGSEDVRLIDTFVSPPDVPAIIVLEPGWPDLTDPTG